MYGGGVKMYAQTEADAKKALENLEQVTDLATLQKEENRNLYIVAMSDLQRGVLFAEEQDKMSQQDQTNLLDENLVGLVGRCGKWSHYTGVNTETEIDRTDARQLFAFIYHKESFYMYNVATKAFCMVSTKNNMHLGLSKTIIQPITIKKDTYFSLSFSADKGINISNGSGHYHAVRLADDSPNGGNQVVLYKVETQLAENDYKAAIELIDGGTTKTIENLIENSKKFIEESGKGTIGYPNKDACTKEIEALEAAIKNYNKDDNNLGTYLTDLQKAYNDYISVTDVNKLNMPVNGQAYRIKAKYADDKYRYIKFDSGKGRLNVTEPDKEPDENDYSDVFICRHIDKNTYSFVYHDGYLVYYASGKNGMGGCSTGCSEKFTDGTNNAEITLTHIAANTVKHGGSVGADKVLGSLCIQALNTKDNDLFYLMAGTGDFHNSYSGDLAYSDALSTFYYFEEAEYPNKPTLVETKGADLEDVQGITTFSAPFAMVVPEQVSAYVVTTISDSDDKVTATLKQLDGKAIPANTGVILCGAAKQVTMLPATVEQQATVESNLLQHKHTAEKDDVTGNDVYLLGEQNGQTAFYPWTNGTLDMNTAYLKYKDADAVLLSFGNSDSTGIETITSNADNANAPVYDLTGRRVTDTLKNGLYIRNGKKFIVK